MIEERVNFRGENDGVHLIVEGGNFRNILIELDKKLKKGKGFYDGAKLLSIYSEELSILEKIEIAYRLKYKFKFVLDDEELTKMMQEDKKEEKKIVEMPQDIYTRCDTLFIHRTVRSGQVITHEGSIVIIGDVNPGAIIEAKLNIIVLGNFRGSGSAGENDENSIIAAYRLNPTQLKIADKIARAPDEKDTDHNRSSLPEIARIINGKIVIEPYLPNK